ncbi:hypothetical protein OIU76_005330 [Salix suchowensis]|nr:hypothetical protein OIU76_005330 [Salix suchowensis]
MTRDHVRPIRHPCIYHPSSDAAAVGLESAHSNIFAMAINLSRLNYHLLQHLQLQSRPVILSKPLEFTWRHVSQLHLMLIQASVLLQPSLLQL